MPVQVQLYMNHMNHAKTEPSGCLAVRARCDSVEAEIHCIPLVNCT